jgi:sialate O-acetylesterase
MPRLPRSIVAVILTVVFAQAASAAGVKLGAPFGDHMVVQRDRPIRVWGEAGAGTNVEVKFGSRQATAMSGPDGQWAVTLDALAPGGPYTLSASAGDTTAKVSDVLVGDVWLCSGQSNMQMVLKECDGGPAAADAASKLKNLRLCTVGRKASSRPETSADIRWETVSPKAAREFSAVALYFAADLLADPALKGVPVGVINSSFGGSPCEAWVPKEALAGVDPKDLGVSMFGGGPAAYYNAMIAPLGRAPIKGVVWYQGESNADKPALYVKLLTALVTSWRARFETPNLPVIVVQLPDWAPGTGSMSWAWLREAEATAVHDNPHMALAVGINSTDGFNLHPKEKAELGRRVALLALRDVYGRPIVASGPAFKEAVADGNALWLKFDTAGDGLVARGGGPVHGFAVAGADGKFLYADATIEGNAVVVRNAKVSDPKWVRYAWAGAPDANLTNRSGLPVAPFRTDTLSPPDADVQRQPSPHHIRMKAYQVTIDGTGSVTSLGVGGKQFLSNGFGNAGGTSLPAWFGVRSLPDVREPGPGLVSCSDDQITFLLDFGAKEMEWAITNRGKDGTKFRIVLAPQVAVGGRGKPGPLTLTRGPATLTVTGVDRVTDSEDGCALEATVGGQATKRLVFTVGGK